MIEYFLPLVEALLNLFGPRTPSADEEAAWKKYRRQVARWTVALLAMLCAALIASFFIYIRY